MTKNQSEGAISSLVGTIKYDYIHNGTSWQPMYGRKIKDSLQTYSGHFIWPLDPKPSEIYITDIAHGLSHENRYANQSPYPYSVAWHSYVLSMVVPKHLQRFALVHDAPEAYIKDIPRIIRNVEPIKTSYGNMDNHLLNVICEKLSVENEMEELLYYDVKMSHCEMLVWSRMNPIYLAKLKWLGVSSKDDFALDWIQWVEKVPMKDHSMESKKIWLSRFQELFPNYSDY